ncbi:MAG: c-type cytochrome [Janthinobacterium lividum]
MHTFPLARPAWLISMALVSSMICHEPVHAADADIAAGKRSFAKCAECHAVGPSARGAFGPQLNGILGRPSASTSDFKYSPAMMNAKIIWSEPKLRAFIKSPDDVVPGTKMRFWGLSNEQEISNLIAYLGTFAQTR